VRNKISPFSSRSTLSLRSIAKRSALNPKRSSIPGGSAATVHLQSIGTTRGLERCGAAVARSDVPLDRLREDLVSPVTEHIRNDRRGKNIQWPLPHPQQTAVGSDARAFFPSGGLRRNWYQGPSVNGMSCVYICTTFSFNCVRFSNHLPRNSWVYWRLCGSGNGIRIASHGTEKVWHPV
jgi:hypothetical protein